MLLKIKIDKLNYFFLKIIILLKKLSNNYNYNLIKKNHLIYPILFILKYYFSKLNNQKMHLLFNLKININNLI